MARKKKPPRRYIRPPTEADAPFIEAILAQPQEDGPRLVYADHLLEHGDTVHGELIAVQCARARLERADAVTTPEYRAALSRELELIAVFNSAWVRTFGAHGIRGEWERGLLAKVTGASPIGLREHWALLTRHPLVEIATFDARGLHRYPDRADLRWLATEARTLERLRISGFEGSATMRAAGLTRDEDGSTWDAGAPLPNESFLPVLTDLSHPHPSSERLRALAETPLAALRSYMLSTNPRLDIAPLDAFVSSPTFAALEALACWNVSLPHALLVLKHAPRGLRTLTVSCELPWQFEHLVADALAECPALPTLEEIRVSVDYEPALVAALAERAPKLERLVLSDVSAAGLEAFAASALPARLRELEVSSAGRDKLAATPLATAGFRRLTALRLQNLRLDQDLARSPALETLVDVRLWSCEAEPAVMDAIHARWPRTRPA